MENLLIKNLKKVKPLFTAIITTADKYTETQFIPGTSLIDATNAKHGLKEYQRVLAVGNMVRNVKEGDIVCVNPSRYAVRKYVKDSLKDTMDEEYNSVIKYNFNVIELNGEECLFLQEADIDFIVEDYE